MEISSYAQSLATTGEAPSDQTVTVDGIRLYGGPRSAALERCLGLVGSGIGGRVATANLDFFALARRDSQLRTDLNDSSLVIIDGTPVAWLARLSGARRAERYAGVDLVRDLCQSAGPALPLRVAVLGSTAEVAGPALSALSALSRHVEFVFVEHPPFRPLPDDEIAAYQASLSSAGPNVVLVALGCPRQERLMAEWQHAAPGALWVGIGGSLDFFAGKRRRAPGWAQRAGLEWVYRMVQDPGRLASRYLLRDIPALLAIAPGVVRTRFSLSKPSRG